MRRSPRSHRDDSVNTPSQSGGTSKKQEPSDPRLTKRAIRLQMAGVGLEFASMVVGGLIVGSWVDDWLGTEPAFTLTFVLAGLVGAMSRLVVLSRRFDRLRRAEEERSSE